MGQFLFRNCVRERKVGSFAVSKKAKNIWAGALAGLMFSVAIFGVMPSGGASALDGHIGHGALGGQAQITPRADDKIIYTTSEGVSVKSQNNNLYTTLDGKVYAVLGQGDGGSTYYVDGYIQKEYIECTGTQYIDTSLPVTASLKMDALFVVNSSQSSSYPTLFGARNLYHSPYGGLYAHTIVHGQNFALYLDSVKSYDSTFRVYGNNSSFLIPCNAKIHMYFDPQKLSLSWPGGESIHNIEQTITPVSHSMLLFNYMRDNQNSTTISPGGYMHGQIYGWKIWQGETLVRDYVPVQCPCKKSIGLYDKVNKVLYENQGTGSFLVGGNAVPEEVANAPVYDSFSYVSENLAEDLHYRTVEGFEMIGGVERGYLLCQSQSDESYLKIRI